MNRTRPKQIVIRVSVYPENVIQAIQHPPRALFKKIHVSIIFLVKSAAIIVVCPRLRPEM